LNHGPYLLSGVAIFSCTFDPNCNSFDNDDDHHHHHHHSIPYREAPPYHLYALL
jgi:hypothetical protein